MLNPFFLWCYLIVGLLIAINTNFEAIKDGKPSIIPTGWALIILFWPILWVVGIFLE